MTIRRLAVTAMAIAFALVAAPRAEPQFHDFDRRIDAYMSLRQAASLTAPPLGVSRDPAEIRRASDELAMAIVLARPGAAQGDILTPRIAAAIRRAVRETCHDSLADLLALAREDQEKPLPQPAIHVRWPSGAPLPTTPPDVLAALPRLPAGLEFRFVNGDLVLRDIDANLIIDFIPGVLPALTELVTAAP